MANVNLFDQKLKVMQGKVVITEMESPFGKGKIVRHVVRNTADDAVVAGEMQKHTDIVRQADMTPVMSAFVASVKTLVAQGNAVRISGLGTFYIKTVADSEAEALEAGRTQDEPVFEVSFTPDKSLNEAAKQAEAEVIQQGNTAPCFEAVEDMDTMKENGELTSGKAAIITGKRLRIAGEDSGLADKTGLYLVPCDSAGNYSEDMSGWIRVDDSEVGRNYMTEVIFRVPKGLLGQYRLGIVTRAALSGSTKEYHLIKKARRAVSSEVFNVV